MNALLDEGKAAGLKRCFVMLSDQPRQSKYIALVFKISTFLNTIEVFKTLVGGASSGIDSY